MSCVPMWGSATDLEENGAFLTDLKHSRPRRDLHFKQVHLRLREHESEPGRGGMRKGRGREVQSGTGRKEDVDPN